MIIFLCLLKTGAVNSTQEELRIHVFLSVDWEGDTLREANLASMRRFNQEFPQYPVIHFLNAAYYTKNWDLDADEVTRRIRSALKPNDELGVHIHSWENFVRESGVEYRPGPSFWNSPVSIGRQGEFGDDVPLNTYDVDEIRKMLRTSKDILERHGFNGLESFRGGGWMSGPKVFEALVAEGFRVDSSAVPVEMVENLYPNTLLSEINFSQWSGVERTSTPFHQNSELLQFPNNAGLADYLDEREFFDVYLDNVRDVQSKGGRDVYVHFGWHQESAVEYFEHKKGGGMELRKVNFLDRVRRGLELIEGHAKSNNFKVLPQDFRSYPQHLLRPNPPAPNTTCQGLLRRLMMMSP